jgi:hypothetical protein
MSFTTRKEGSKIIIEIDTANAEAAPKSKSGKSRLVASTAGFFKIPETNFSLSMNVTAPLNG